MVKGTRPLYVTLGEELCVGGVGIFLGIDSLYNAAPVGPRPCHDRPPCLLFRSLHGPVERALQLLLVQPVLFINALLALQDAHVLGAALFSPVFSTVRGGAGAYVSDLWVAPEARGQALGTALLAAVAGLSRSDWNASFIKLVSYSDNNEALRFYARLGFASLRGETGLTLSGAPLAALSRQTQKDPQ